MSELKALELPRTEGNRQTISSKTECAQVSDHVPPCVTIPQLENQDEPISLAKGQPHEGQQNIPSVNPVSAILGSAYLEALRPRPPTCPLFLAPSWAAPAAMDGMQGLQTLHDQGTTEK